MRPRKRLPEGKMPVSRPAQLANESTARPAASGQRPAASGQRPAASGQGMLARWNPAAWVPAVIGGILLVAAGFQRASLQFERSIHSHLSAADAPTLIAIVSEIFIAVWLFSGHAPTWARRATMLLLAVFLCTAAWRWYAGEADCGCFGAVAIHPAWTMALGAVLLLTLLGSHWKLPAPTMAFEASTARGIVGAICVFALTFLAAREYLSLIHISEPTRQAEI